MRARVFVAEVVHVAGDDGRQAALLGELREQRVDALLHVEVRVLHLDVDVVLAEDRREAVELALGVVGAPLLERLADAAREAAAERDEPGAVPVEQLPVDARLVVVALEVAERAELDQVRVALVRLGEERQVRVALLLGLAVVGDVDLAAEDRLDAVLFRRLDEVDRARERAVVGEPDGGHLELGRAGRELGNPARPVEDRELGVDVQMDEIGQRARAANLQGRSRRPLAGGHFDDLLDHPAVDDVARAGHVGGLVGAEPGDESGHFLGLSGAVRAAPRSRACGRPPRSGASRSRRARPS